MQTEVDVSTYAGTAGRSPYDVLARHNREYQLLLQRIAKLFATWAPAARRIADLGCGTGNFTRVLLEALPTTTVMAADASVAMLEVLRGKLASERLRVQTVDLLVATSFAAGSFEAINVTHALNYTGEPQRALHHLANWLSPGGLLVVTDIGRPLVVANWTRPVLRWIREDLRAEGRGPLGAFFGSLQLGLSNRAAARENERFARGQGSGRYPLHSPAEFRAWIEAAGLQVLEVEGAYRDPSTGEPMSDLVVARRPMV